MQTHTHDMEKTIDVLNMFLRGELSAVETYRQALTKVEDATLRQTLEECQRSHSERVSRLRDRVRALGGTASEDSGAWGAFAKAVEGSAALFGDRAAVAALEEGEDHGLKDYRNEIEKLAYPERQLIETTLMPAQEQTHKKMSLLKRSLAH